MNCDKCGRPVSPDNDAARLERLRGKGLFALPRHLFPTEYCEGSPSRIQYLGGLPDTRGKYEIDPELFPVYQAAYAKLITE